MERERSSTADGPRRLAALSLAALGVVYGDIGTSPLYAVRECFFGSFGISPTRGNVLGVLSLVLWSLVVVISVKYLAVVVRADSQGEGGILALMELVRRVSRGPTRRIVVATGLFGAALLYGDGMITPAISVLSAVEGLEVATAVFRPYVLPVAVAVLVALFALQRRGTDAVGRLFGPLMAVWFVAIATLGAVAIAARPEVLAALDPRRGLDLLLHGGAAGIGILGIVFLVVTGGEALYADIGHFGTAPIRIGWYALALPSLLLNYFGQGALLLARPGDVRNPFFQLAPAWMLYPLVLLATAATVVASQAIISGAFSLTSQATRLGYLPRVRVLHTSHEQRGQIYVPVVNWALLAATVALVLGFRRSGALAAAYGVAIATTMVITTMLLYFAMRRVFRWPALPCAAVALAFLGVDLAFFTANVLKILDGGWVPLLVASTVYLVMATWRRGRATEQRRVRNRLVPVRKMLAEIGGGGKYRRVPGQAVYLAGNPRGTPHALLHNLEHNHALHASVVIYTASFVRRPYVRDGDRLEIDRLREDIHRVVAHYGFMESPDVPRDLAEADRRTGIGLDLERVTYFVGEQLVTPDERFGMSGWRSRLYAAMSRNEERTFEYFNLPAARVFEVGTQVPV